MEVYHFNVVGKNGDDDDGSISWMQLRHTYKATKSRKPRQGKQTHLSMSVFHSLV